MTEWTAFVAACVSSGTILMPACAMLIVPLAAWAVIRALVPTLQRMDADCAWQAALAAAAAIVPGGLLLALGAAGIVSGLHSPCLETFAGRLLFALIWGALIVVLTRAIVRTARRHREARLLISASRVPSKRLSAAAQRTGIVARELPDTEAFCALAGILQSVVVVSSGTVAQLSDAELDAALLHERGHALRGDQLVAAALTFLVDLLPLPAQDLVDLYRDAREVAADQHALRTAAAHDLAGALLSFARGQRVVGHSSAFAGTGLRHRLQLLLRDATPPAIAFHRRIIAAAVLSLVLSAGLVPVGASLLRAAPCEYQHGTTHLGS